MGQSKHFCKQSLKSIWRILNTGLALENEHKIHIDNFILIKNVWDVEKNVDALESL